MKSYVLTWGLISGSVLAALSAIFIPLCMSGAIDFAYGQLIGYASMVAAFMVVFYGIRKYRDDRGGSITFGQAFKVGILMALVTCAVYVVAWEIVYWGFIPDFEDKYAAIALDRARQEGASAEKIAELQRQMAQFKAWYKNPVYNVLITFVEVFPVGLVMTLISAAILRRKTPGAPTAATAIA
jgi:Protein of unknown function (DUF4199)